MIVARNYTSKKQDAVYGDKNVASGVLSLPLRVSVGCTSLVSIGYKKPGDKLLDKSGSPASDLEMESREEGKRKPGEGNGMKDCVEQCTAVLTFC